MKVMIEIDLPEGQKIPTADDIKRLTNPDWLAEWWHIDDIKDNYRGDMSDEQAREVLQYMEKSYYIIFFLCFRFLTFSSYLCLHKSDSFKVHI